MASYKSKDVLDSFARLVSKDYLGEQHTPLTDALEKIAVQEGLTPSQIEYVAGIANRETWKTLFEMDKKASYDFPLADAAAVVTQLKCSPSDGGEIKEIDLDYLAPPMSTKVASYDPFKAFGFIEENMDKTAELAKRELKHQLQARFEKLSYAKEELERLAMVTATRIEDLELKFVKEARNMIIPENLEARPAAFEKIATFVSACGGKREYAVRLMGKLAHVLKRQGLVKEADLKAPESLISKNLPAQVINGRHALYITIKTLHDNYAERDNIHARTLIVDGSLPVLKEKIREL